MKSVFELHGVDITLETSEKLRELDYVNVLVCLLESTEHALRALDRLSRALVLLGLCFAP